MTQNERWQKNYEGVKTFIESNHRNLSKYDLTERRLYTWLKHNRKEMNAEVMVKHFGPQLIEMLKRYSDDFDYQELKVRVPNVYFILRNIARWMEPMCSGESSIEYWMNAPAVNRFNIG